MDALHLHAMGLALLEGADEHSTDHTNQQSEGRLRKDVNRAEEKRENDNLCFHIGPQFKRVIMLLAS
jgi:hypothetical protein